MNKNIVIAVDAMGGDIGPSVTIPGALAAARQTGVSLLLVGDEKKVAEELNNHDVPDGVEIVHAPEVAEMREKPSDILRRKKGASIQIACNLVREGRAQGLVSAGHSGATVACGMFILGRINGVERPALASVLPTEKQPMVLLDVGANVDCRPHHLFQFGLMADAFARDLLNIASPRVSILSIGEEEGKGNLQVKEAYELFKMAQNLNFVGNVEGRDVFTGNVDVVVCDGFIGNVAIKLSEGFVGSMSRILKKELLSGVVATLGALLAKGAFKRFARVVDYAEYGGAPILGLKDIAVVCHGASNAKAIQNGVKLAATYVEKKTNQRLVASIAANEELTRYSKASATC